MCIVNRELSKEKQTNKDLLENFDELLSKLDKKCD